MERRIGEQHHEASGNESRTHGPSSVKYLDSLSPYKPVSSLMRIWENPKQVSYKLDWNESTIPPSPKVYQAIVRFLSYANHLNWYPELGSTSLAEALTEYVNLDAENILVTNGSDDALELVCKAYLGPDDRVLVPVPTYTHFFVYVQARGSQMVQFHSSELFDSDIERLDAAITPDTRLVYLVNPNNPTGVVYESDDVAALLESHPQTLFIVDEAYYEFHGKSVVHLVGEYDNLVVTRTFSKCFGIAGLRMGYLCTSVPVMTELKKLFNPKSVNRLGQIAAMACLSDPVYYDNLVEEVTEAKVLLRSEMTRRGYRIVTTPANYVLLEVPNPSRFCRLLEDEGVYIRDRSTLPRMEHFVRITVPTVAQAHEVIARIDRVLDRM